MQFFNSHKKLIEDHNLVQFFINKFAYEEVLLKENTDFYVNDEQLIIVLTGLMLKKNQNDGTGSYQYSFGTEGDFVFKVKSRDTYTLSLTSIKSCKVAVFDKYTVFNDLERESLLGHLFLKQYLKVETEMYDLNLGLINTTKRVSQMMLQIAQLNQTAFQLAQLTFPKEIKLVDLAKYCRCSQGTAMKLMRRLIADSCLVPIEEGFLIPADKVNRF